MNRHDTSIRSVASRVRGPGADRLCVIAPSGGFLSLNIGNPINRALDLAQTNAPRADPRSCGGSVGEVTSSVRRLVEFLRADVAGPGARLTVIHGVLGAFFAASRPFCGRWVSTGSPLQFRRTTRRRLRARTCHETGSDGLGIESCCPVAVAIRIVVCPCDGGQTRGQPNRYARLHCGRQAAIP